MLQESHWVLVKFSNFPNFEIAQSVEFRGVTEQQNRGPQSFTRGQSPKSVLLQLLKNSAAKLAFGHLN
jgi:hypothetical protein